MRSFSATLAAVLLLTPLPVTARDTCDVAGADASALAAAYTAIDVACPCTNAVSASTYRYCAREAVAARVANMSLPRICRRDAKHYASRSVCGWESAVACCRVDGTGRTRHRVFRDPANCVDDHGFSACVSQWQSTVTGCDAAGCVVPVCGNAVVDPGEDCDPPSVICDATCHLLPPYCGNAVVDPGEDCDPPSVTCDTTCHWPRPYCGNLVIEAGEACEPPGIGSCDPQCQAAPCAPAGPGETDVSCVAGTTRLSAAGSATGYLLAWSGPFERAGEALAIRLDSNGAVADTSLTVASSELPAGTVSSYPSAASDSTGYYVAWSAYGDVPGFPGVIEQTIRGRRFGAASGAAATDVLISKIPSGYCRESIGGPTAASAAGTSRFAVAWQSITSCGGGVINRDPDGAFIDFATAPAIASAPLGFPLPLSLPAIMSTSPATVATLGGSSLWVWHAKDCNADATCVPFVAAAWSDETVTQGPFGLTSSNEPLSSPLFVATGATSFLVTWSQQNSDGTASEVRALRVTRADGPLDPDGGVLLATVPTGISGGPVAAFDGLRWLVAWTQSGATNYEVRAVAVDADGTVVDPAPRLVASGVATTSPTAASAGDGRVLVAFTRDDVTHTAIRATLVAP